MAKNVQTAYDSVLGRAAVTLVSVHRQRQDTAVAQVGRWETRRIPSWWTMVWSGAQGYEARGVAGGRADEVVARAARSWCLHAPGSAFSERLPNRDVQRESLYLYFTISGSLPPLSSRRFTLVLDFEDRITDLVRTMHRAQERGAPGDALVAHGLLLAALGEILVCAHDGGAGNDAEPWRLRAPESRGPEQGLLAAIDLQVARSPASPPAREDLAKALGMSVSSLAHRFRSETGMTIVERIRWLRIREAKTRLAEPGATVKSVALSLGFSSPFYFSRVFKEVASLTPERFLTQVRS